MSLIHTFSHKGCTKDQAVWNRSGIRGRRAYELAEMNLPIVPGFVIDSHVCAALDRTDLKTLMKDGIQAVETEVGRKYGDAENPLLVKAVFNSNLSLPIFPSVFNLGLSPLTIPGFAKLIGEDKAWFEYMYLLRTAGTKIYGIEGAKFDEIEAKYASETDSVSRLKKTAEDMLNLVGKENVPDDPFEQLNVIIRNGVKKYSDSDLDPDDNITVLVQGMVFGNLGEDSSVGMYFTRDIISGEDKISGSYLKNSYTLDKKGDNISGLDPLYLDELRKTGKVLEKKFREIREVKFIVEKKKLWLINQTSVDSKSTQAHIRTLLDLYKSGEVDPAWMVEQIPPGQLATLLHPVVDPKSLEGIQIIEGGLGGAPGAAVGRVFFSADDLMEAHREALQKGEDTRLILCVQSSFAEDVKAIEVGKGVISVDGGYSSHAPVVARSLGKVSIINRSIIVDKANKQFTLNGVVIKEGDYVTIDVPVYKPPMIGLGKATLINPDIKTNGLVEFIEVVKKYVDKNFYVRANADLGRDARVAKEMGASGIGLCRTEHMFFQDDRIMRFREMILASDFNARISALKDLQPLQKSDFYDLFRTMAPHPVTIRLLDAPLHEFLPRNEDVLNEFMDYLKGKGKESDKKKISDQIERLHEFNPMLGHRGCRVAVTYPEIYEMQVRAIFEAACQLKREGVEIIPEIMIPIVMNPSELIFIKNGKKIEGKEIKGIVDIAEEVFRAEGVTIEYKTGTMVELPAAALLSDELARYAEFFSYGTNDLTQTTMGLSRDDVNSFFPYYTEFDLIADNPFQVLVTPVKELVRISAERGRLTRPDIKLGLCGEHGADPVNIEFCISSGLQYVSVSPYNVPIALLAVAQNNLKKKDK